MTPRVLVSGSRGLIGSALVPFLMAEGWQVVRLIRPGPSGKEKKEKAAGDALDAVIAWDPEAQELDPAALEGFDAVIHLAGENIGDGRWTKARRKRIRRSRISGTALLCDRLAHVQHPPRVFVQASATGFYGNRGEEILREESAPGTGFLAELTQAWEEASRPAQSAGIRVVQARLGVVLTPKGGAMARMLPLFRWGLGGPLGGGGQFMSWIVLPDLLGAIGHILTQTALQGPVNVTAPEAVRNREFVRVLGKILGRPVLLPVPSAALRLVFGQMAEETILTSQHVRPVKLLESGYSFRHPRLEEALRHELDLAVAAQGKADR